MKLHEITAPHAQIEQFLDSHRIKNYTIHPDGTVDVDGDVDLRNLKGTSLPVQFGKVRGDFDYDRTKITSLKGAPQAVGGGFYCGNTPITSLKGAPQSVGSDFYCHNTKITSLEGAPQYVGGDFGCSNTNITNLDGAPQTVGGSFYCGDTLLHGLLRLLDIKGLNSVVFDHGPIDAILDKYVGTGDILSAQDELIDAGFAKVARM